MKLPRFRPKRDISTLSLCTDPCPKLSTAFRLDTERNDNARLKPVLNELQSQPSRIRNRAQIEIHHGAQIEIYHGVDKLFGSFRAVFHRATVAIKSTLIKLKSNQQPFHLTMSSPLPVRDATTITNPPLDYYKVPQEGTLTCRTIPFVSKDQAGIGTMLTSKDEMESVLVNANGDAIRLNETKNPYAVKIASLVLLDMRKRKDELKQAKKGIRMGERLSFDTIITKEMQTMADQAGYDHEEKLLDRRRNTFWYIMRGFNTTDGSKFNDALDDILYLFIERRMGIVAGEFDEFEAAVNAVQDYYVNKQSKDNKTRGEGQWTFPAVHLLNGHLIARRMTPISFHPEMDMDEACKTNERATHDKTIWTGGVKARVETRTNVLDQYKAFMMEVYEEEIEVPQDEGEPTVTQVTETGGKRRRSFGFSDSARKKK